MQNPANLRILREMITQVPMIVEAGRLAYESGRMPKKLYASASSPLAGVVGS